jgi:hypothetical protein
MNNKRIIASAATLVMIPLIMLLFHNELSNWHYHTLSNGLLVKHAHPYDKSEKPNSPIGGHQHSNFEILMLAQLSVIPMVLLTFFLSLHKFYKSGKQVFSWHSPIFNDQQLLNLCFLRAPPVLAHIKSL